MCGGQAQVCPDLMRGCREQSAGAVAKGRSNMKAVLNARQRLHGTGEVGAHTAAGRLDYRQADDELIGWRGIPRRMYCFVTSQAVVGGAGRRGVSGIPYTGGGGRG